MLSKYQSILYMPLTKFKIKAAGQDLHPGRSLTYSKHVSDSPLACRPQAMKI